MNFGSAFSFVFQDPDWIKKVLIAALISLIPVVGQIYLLGWGLAVTKRLIDGESSPLLPETDFGKHLGNGFKAFVVAFVYTLPIYIIMLPMIISTSVLPSMDMDSDTMGIVITMVSVCCGSIAALYGIFMGFLLPAAYGTMMAKGSIGAGLRFSEVFGLVKAAPVAYLITILGTIVASFVASLGSIACGIGVLVTLPYSFLIMSHFYGQAYNQAKSMQAAKNF